MEHNYDDFYADYSKLSLEDRSSSEILFGEDAAEIVKNKGTSEEKWDRDRFTIQNAQRIMAEDLAKGTPEDVEDIKARVCGIISNQIDIKLGTMEDEATRRGWLLHTIQLGEAVKDMSPDDLKKLDSTSILKKLEDEENSQNITTLGYKSEEELKWELCEAVWDWTVNSTIPMMIEHQNNLHINEAEEKRVKIENAGAAAVAAYANISEFQEIPELAGMAMETVCITNADFSANDNKLKIEDILDKLAYGLIAVAAIFTYFILVGLEMSFVLGAIYAAVEGTSFAVGFATFYAIIETGIINFSFYALCTGVLSAITKIASKIIHHRRTKKEDDNKEEHFNNNVVNVVTNY